MLNPDPLNPSKTSGTHQTYWLESKPAPAFAPLNHSVSTDVLVIGGGISGLNTAYCLLKSGKKVVLVEDGQLFSGETGRTTAHLTVALGYRYSELISRFGKDTAARIAESHQAAINWIENTAKLENIDCDFKRVDGYLFLDPTDEAKTLEDEYAATKDLGLLTDMKAQVPGLSAEEGERAIHYPEQGQFHVTKFLTGIAQAIVRMGGEIYTNSKAEHINSEGAKVNGFDIKAQHIVVATNTPVNDFVTMHTKQWPYRTYVIGCKIPKGTLPYALWWDTGNQDSKWIEKPYHYLRLNPFDETHDLLISGGEDHRTGQADDEHISEEDRYTRLIEWTKKRVPAAHTVDYRWSGQVMEPLDGIAFLGKNPGDDNVYILTGHSGNGMTHGTIGAIIITDLIKGQKNTWTDIYSPSRIKLGTAGDYLKEIGNMTVQYGDWFNSGDVPEVTDLKAGEGGIISHGLHKIAAYRDEQGAIHAFNAVCPHLGCIVQYNGDEKSFDCPCHGSRFSTSGKVVYGPANRDLKRVELKS